LYKGREKSLYTDFVNDKVTIPSEIVDRDTAKDTLNLAEKIYELTKRFIEKSKPKNFSSLENRLYTIHQDKLLKIFSSQDFWEYFIVSSKGDIRLNFHEYAVKYHDEYLCKNKMFKTI